MLLIRSAFLSFGFARCRSHLAFLYANLVSFGHDVSQSIPGLYLLPSLNGFFDLTFFSFFVDLAFFLIFFLTRVGGGVCSSLLSVSDLPSLSLSTIGAHFGFRLVLHRLVLSLLILRMAVRNSSIFFSSALPFPPAPCPSAQLMPTIRESCHSLQCSPPQTHFSSTIRSTPQTFRFQAPLLRRMEPNGRTS